MPPRKNGSILAAFMMAMVVLAIIISSLSVNMGQYFRSGERTIDLAGDLNLLLSGIASQVTMDDPLGTRLLPSTETTWSVRDFYANVPGVPRPQFLLNIPDDDVSVNIHYDNEVQIGTWYDPDRGVDVPIFGDRKIVVTVWIRSSHGMLYSEALKQINSFRKNRGVTEASIEKTTFSNGFLSQYPNYMTLVLTTNSIRKHADI